MSAVINKLFLPVHTLLVLFIFRSHIFQICYFICSAYVIVRRQVLVFPVIETHTANLKFLLASINWTLK